MITWDYEDFQSLVGVVIDLPYMVNKTEVHEFFAVVDCGRNDFGIGVLKLKALDTGGDFKITTTELVSLGCARVVMNPDEYIKTRLRTMRIGKHECTNPVEVTNMGDLSPTHICGCGRYASH